MPVTTIQIRWPDIFRFHIAPGTENQIAVTPTLMSTSSNAMSRSTLQRKNICLSRLLWPLEWYWPGSTLSKGIVTMKMKLLSSSYHGTMVTGVVLCCVIMPLCHCAIALPCARYHWQVWDEQLPVWSGLWEHLGAMQVGSNIDISNTIYLSIECVLYVTFCCTRYIHNLGARLAFTWWAGTRRWRLTRSAWGQTSLAWMTSWIGWVRLKYKS